ncbi:MAG: hypothetical protein MUF73_05680 [Rhodobacteraceae bacterium]|jgi:hypothetical protein|nr:hypothetical protein [Paracoccaceae bacterium]
MRVLAALVLAVLPLPAPAQMLPGADDPAYRGAITAALSSDDPQAMADLHRLAEGGNAAATVALATVTGWYSVGTTLAERRVFRSVNGVMVAEAAAALHPPFGVWVNRASVPAADLVTGAETLVAAGEPLKAGQVLNLWLGQTGALADVPAGFWTDLPVAPWTRAMALVSRMTSPPGITPLEIAILATWLDEDRPEGWVALHMLDSSGLVSVNAQGGGPLDRVVAARISTRDPAEVTIRQAAAAALHDLLMGKAVPDAVDPVAMDRVAALLAQSGADLPLRLWCSAACPADPDTCTGAAVAAFGLRPMLVDDTAPMAAALPLADYYASPRGRYQVLSAGFMAHGAGVGDPEAIETALRGPAMTRAVAMDACFGAAVQGALPDLVTRRFSR